MLCRGVCILCTGECVCCVEGCVCCVEGSVYVEGSVWECMLCRGVYAV